MKKLKNFILFLFAILAVGYVSFPLWITAVASLILPQDVKINRLEIGWPRISSIKLNLIELEIAGNQITLNATLANWTTRMVEIDKAIVELGSQDDLPSSSDSRGLSKSKVIRELLTQFDRFELPPKINNSLESLPTISIKQLSMLVSSETIELDNILLSKNKNESATPEINKPKEKQILLISADKLSASVISKNDLSKVGTRQWQNLSVQFSADRQSLRANVSLEDFDLLNLSLNDLPKKKLNVTFSKKLFEVIQPTRFYAPLVNSSDANVGIENIKLLEPINFSIENNRNTKYQISLSASSKMTTHKNETINYGFKLNSDISLNSSLVTSNLTLDSHLSLVTPLEIVEKTVQPFSLSLVGQMGFTVNQDKIDVSPTRLEVKSKLISAADEKKQQMVNISDLNASIDINGWQIADDLVGRFSAKINTHLNLDVDSAKLGGLLSLDVSDLTTKLDEGSIELNWLLNNLNFNASELPESTIKTKITFDERDIKSEGEISLGGQVSVPFSSVVNKASKKVVLKLQENRYAIADFQSIAESVIKQPNFLLSLDSGDLKQSGELIFESSGKDSANLQSSIEGARLTVNDNILNGINYQQHLSAIQPVKIESTISVESIQLKSGLTVSNLSANISGAPELRLDIRDLKADLFEGSLASNQITIENKNLSPSTLQLANIDLTELLFFADVSGLYAEGRLDMTLPISQISGAPVITDGKFESVGKGLVKYATADAGDNNASEQNIALQAIQNFHYEALDGTINYDQDGNYHIKLHLKGANPDLYDGYPIDFVLNLNGQLSGVFRSLFLTGDFQEAVLEQAKSSGLTPP